MPVMAVPVSGAGAPADGLAGQDLRVAVESLAVGAAHGQPMRLTGAGCAAVFAELDRLRAAEAERDQLVQALADAEHRHALLRDQADELAGQVTRMQVELVRRANVLAFRVLAELERNTAAPAADGPPA